MKKSIRYILAIIISVPAGLYVEYLIAGKLNASSIVSSVIVIITTLCIVEYLNYRNTVK